MNVLQFLGIYPDAIEYAAEKAEAAMEDAGASLPDIDYMYDVVRDSFKEKELDFENVTNSLISKFFEYAKSVLEKELSGAEVTYCVNCNDSHFYVNGEEYYKGDNTITDLRRGIDIPSVEMTEYGNIPALRAALNIEDDDILADLLNGAEDKHSDSLADIYDKDGYEIIEEIDAAQVLMNFEAFVLLLENGKRVYEIKVFDEKADEERIVRADRTEQLQEADKLRIKTDMALRSLKKEGCILDAEEEYFLEKHLLNREQYSSDSIL
ncbi:hypothetical protein [Ruminococcus albus]|uniref:Uncharacterized protein n=1 Tax=Ruminococcus albus 8 TaxID=246199 RepID=E9SES9_RUMAL|nr:hypothetical protein [Ruminococcus albus]EGC02203.1 hypothetical protein CUS_4817 [Ruminococcus albus 8]MCC3351870.1 hypothetical protein [Ruminococcus albus 8]